MDKTMSKKILKYIVISAGISAAMSCTGNYLEINSNPYGVTDDEMLRDGYALKSAFVNMAGAVISPDKNTTQFTEILLGCDLVGYTAPAKNDWKNTIANYNPTDDWSRVLMQSDLVIPVLYTNLKRLKALTDDPVYLAVGDIIKVVAMHRVADTYGPIPYSQIGANGELSVKYDSQQEAYALMLKELSNAVDVLTINRTNNFTAAIDPIYGGNVEKWIRLANSLKLRLAMRISYADPELSKTMAEEAVSHEIGVMQSNDHNAMFSSWGTNGNTLRAAVMYNIVKHDNGENCATNVGDSHAGAEIVCYMNGYDDPRREKYFTKSEWEGFPEYVGMRHGIVIPSPADIGHKYSGIFFAQDAAEPACWMNAAEVAFLQAEAAAVFGYNMGQDAKSLYEKGIRLSFTQYGLAGRADEYITSGIVEENSYTDPAGNNNYGYALTTLPVAWDENASLEQKQERIIIQKYIANWLLGNESWADWRRTGYPNLFPASDSGNWSKNEVSSKKGARRMPYPAAEVTNNTVHYQQALTKLKEESADYHDDKMSTRLWFDCKANNPSYK